MHAYYVYIKLGLECQLFSIFLFDGIKSGKIKSDILACDCLFLQGLIKMSEYPPRCCQSRAYSFFLLGLPAVDH